MDDSLCNVILLFLYTAILSTIYLMSSLIRICRKDRTFELVVDFAYVILVLAIYSLNLFLSVSFSLDVHTLVQPI